MLLFFCKLKNRINSIYGFIGEHKIFLKAFFVAVAGGIFFPCLYESNMFFRVEEKVKFVDSHIVFFKSGIKDMRGLVCSFVDRDFYFENLGGKRITEALSRKCLSVVSGDVDGNKIGTKNTKSYTKERPCDGEEGTAYDLWHTFLLWLWPIGPICFVVGVVATIIGNFILIYFTQR